MTSIIRDREQVALYLRTERRRMGVTQEAMAESWGVDQSTYSRWERCIGRLPVLLMVPLTGGTSVTAPELFYAEPYTDRPEGNECTPAQ